MDLVLVLVGIGVLGCALVVLVWADEWRRAVMSDDERFR